jgi:Uma2 family endonuclease
MFPETLTRELPSDAPVRFVAQRPIRFSEFVRLTDREDDYELIDGALVRKMVAFSDHETLFSWLHRLMGDFVEKRSLGKLYGSRTAVEIHAYRGRLPDLVFVRQENLAIIQQEGIFGTPDLIIELVSPNDRPGDVIALETDYRQIQTPEILFIHQKKRQVRLLRRRDTDYEETLLTTGAFELESIPGFTLETDWLFEEPRPIIYDLLTHMLQRDE